MKRRSVENERTITVNDLKRTVGRAVAVITAVLAIPLGIKGLDLTAPCLAVLAETAGKASAKLTFITPGYSLPEAPEASGETTVIDYPMEEILRKNGGFQMGSGSAWNIDMAPDEIETPTEIPPLPTPSEDILNAVPYPDSLENRDGVIETVHYGLYTAPYYINLKNGGQVRNCTNLPNSVLEEADGSPLPFEVDAKSKEPQVLIYHTHTTESFEPYTRDFYDKSFTTKTTDMTKNMVAVGNAICARLEEAGIATLHDTTVHDYPSYNGSYQSSRQTVSEILEEYPSIKVVLDVHRDGIEREDGTRIAPVAEIDGKRAAQIMIISCCDDGDGELPDFMENFRFACALQSRIETDWEGLTRPVLFDCRHYNQDLSTGSLLIEVGSHGNSLDEALTSGDLIGQSLVKLLTE